MMKTGGKQTTPKKKQNAGPKKTIRILARPQQKSRQRRRKSANRTWTTQKRPVNANRKSTASPYLAEQVLRKENIGNRCITATPDRRRAHRIGNHRNRDCIRARRSRRSSRRSSRRRTRRNRGGGGQKGGNPTRPEQKRGGEQDRIASQERAKRDASLRKERIRTGKNNGEKKKRLRMRRKIKQMQAKLHQERLQAGKQQRRKTHRLNENESDRLNELKKELGETQRMLTL